VCYPSDAIDELRVIFLPARRHLTADPSGSLSGKTFVNQDSNRLCAPTEVLQLDALLPEQVHKVEARG
jgi:hypothetical protein